MVIKEIKPKLRIFHRSLALPSFRYFSINPVLSLKLLRRYSCFLFVASMALYGCAPLNTSNNGGVPFTPPKISDPAVQGLMSFFSGLLGREDLLSRHTMDDYVLALEAVLNEAGWGKAIDHGAYEKVIGDVQEHLDDPNKSYLDPITPEMNPYAEGTWEHESFDTQHTSTCARDFPELAASNPEICK